MRAYLTGMHVYATKTQTVDGGEMLTADTYMMKRKIQDGPRRKNREHSVSFTKGVSQYLSSAEVGHKPAR